MLAPDPHPPIESPAGLRLARPLVPQAGAHTARPLPLRRTTATMRAPAEDRPPSPARAAPGRHSVRGPSRPLASPQPPPEQPPRLSLKPTWWLLPPARQTHNWCGQPQPPRGSRAHLECRSSSISTAGPTPFWSLVILLFLDGRSCRNGAASRAVGEGGEHPRTGTCWARPDAGKGA